MSLFIFSPTNAFRKQCIALSYDKRFSNFIIACILINCIFLAAVNPVCQTYASLDEIQEKCTAAEYDMIIAADVAGCAVACTQSCMAAPGRRALTWHCYAHRSHSGV